MAPDSETLSGSGRETNLAGGPRQGMAGDPRAAARGCCGHLHTQRWRPCPSSPRPNSRHCSSSTRWAPFLPSSLD
jgi:hypothetical protein